MLLTPRDEEDFRWLQSHGILSEQAARKVREAMLELPDDSVIRYAHGGQVRAVAESLDLLTLNANVIFETYEICAQVQAELGSATFEAKMREVMRRGRGTFDPSLVLRVLSGRIP